MSKLVTPTIPIGRHRVQDRTMPILMSSSDVETSSSSSSKSVSDNQILKGAEIIRAQIQQREGSTPDTSHETLEEEKPELPTPFSEDDWSDPWRVRSPQASVLTGPTFGSTSLSFPDDETSGKHPTRGLDKSIAEDDSNFPSLSDWPEPAEFPAIQPKEDQEPPPPPQDLTPVTYMGRGNKLKLKIHTYNVQRYDDMGDESLLSGEDSLDAIARSFSHDQMDEELIDGSYIPTPLQVGRVASPPPQPSVQLYPHEDDPAYQHAQNAGHLWQTLVGQHVRFPKTWWNGERSPPMGMIEDWSPDGKERCNWQYVVRQRVHASKFLMQKVPTRGSPGRILLHIMVRDLVTWLPVQDIAIGCFHPNAKGIRKTEKPDPNDESCREVWMAVRKRAEDGAVSVIDPLLTTGQRLEDISSRSPLGKGRRITNKNMRAVFGDKPPLRTVMVLESELYERMTPSSKDPESSLLPALVLLKEFLPES